MPKLKPGQVSPTPQEDERIAAGIAADPDTRELTDSDFGAMRPASEVLPQELVKRPRDPGSTSEAFS